MNQKATLGLDGLVTIESLRAVLIDAGFGWPKAPWSETSKLYHQTILRAQRDALLELFSEWISDAAIVTEWDSPEKGHILSFLVRRIASLRKASGSKS